jgi:hypothetical protein
VNLLHSRSLFGVERMADFPAERIHEQAAAHSDSPMNAPSRELDPGLFERFLPGKHVLIDAVDQSAIQVEDEPDLAWRTRWALSTSPNRFG